MKWKWIGYGMIDLKALHAFPLHALPSSQLWARLVMHHTYVRRLALSPKQGKDVRPEEESHHQGWLYHQESHLLCSTWWTFEVIALFPMPPCITSQLSLHFLIDSLQELSFSLTVEHRINKVMQQRSLSCCRVVMGVLLRCTGWCCKSAVGPCYCLDRTARRMRPWAHAIGYEPYNIFARI